MSPPTRRIAVLAALLALSTAPALAQGGAIEIGDAWARASAGMAQTGVVYLSIANRGQVADRLIGMTSAEAATVQLHDTSNVGGIMRMRSVGVLELKPGARAELRPSGMHIMLLGLRQPLVPGRHLTLTLNFEKAGKVEVAVPIHGIGSQRGPQ
jgi:copper(I)-binding protein